MNDCLRTYILQFLYKDGNGWAIVNARTPQQAENIFKIQTKFNKPKVTNIKESKWYGENMQLVYEGTTITGNLSPYDLAVMEGYVGSLDEWLKTLKGEKGDPGEKGDKGDTFTYEDLTEEQLDEIGEHVPLNDYYTKEETNSKVESISPLIVHCAQVQGVASELYLPDVEYTTAMSAYTSGRDIIIYNVNFGYLKMTVSAEGLFIATSQTFGDSNYVFSWTPNVEPMYGDPRYGIIQQTVTRLATEEDLTNYQPKLVAGAGITITGNVISAPSSSDDAYAYPIIDVSVGNNTGAIVPASSGHTWSTGTAYKGRCFDVSDKRGWKLRIRHGDSFATCNFAFLNATPANNQPISYCDGETYHNGVSEEVVTVPSDATLLYVQRLSSGGNVMTPVVEILTKDKDTMYGLSESIDELKEHDFDPTTIVDTPIQAIATKSGYYLVKSRSGGLQRGDIQTGSAWRIVLFEVTVGDVVSITTSGNSTSGTPMYAAWYSEPEVAEDNEVVDSLSHDSYVNYAVLNCVDSNRKNTVTVPSGAVYLALSLSTTGQTKVTKQETVNRIDLLEDKVAVLEDDGETMTLNGRLKAIEGSSSIIDTTTKKVLIFGNSYSYDAFGFLPHIIKVSNAGLALTLGVCMDGSQTLAGQLAHANNPSSYYTRYSKHSGSSWTNDYHKSFDSAVEDEDWDLIVFHQSSNLSCSLSSITPYLPQLISHLRDNGYTGKIGWLVTPAYAEGTTSGNVNKLSNVANTLGLDHTLTTDEMQHRIYDVADYLKSHYAIDVVFPCGMAIGYARHSVLDNIGEWSPADALGGNLVYKDGHHLQYGVGNLVESWVAALVLTRGRCAMADINSWGWMNGDIMSSDSKAKGMDSESQRIARECAYKAYHQFLKYNIENATDLIRGSGFVDNTTLTTALSGKQDSLTAGTGINITNNVISATGGGGGGDALIVTLTPSQGNQFTPDKTFAEVSAAYAEGRKVLFSITQESASMLVDVHYSLGVSGSSMLTATIVDGDVVVALIWQSSSTYVTRTQTILQPQLTFDNVPTQSSNNPVKSGGVFTALQSKADAAALQNFCPLIEDTRSSAEANITGVAPFSELVDGQRIVLHFARRSVASSTLTLTLSGGNTTATIPIYRQIYNNVSQLGYLDVRENTFYILIYQASVSRWWIVGCVDSNTTYGAITQAEITAGSSTYVRLVTTKLLVDNFEKRTQLIEVDNQSAQVEQALESNTFYKFLNPVDELTLTFVTPTGYGNIMAIYGGKFTASTNWSALSLPATIDEAAGNDTIEGGKTYEFNVLDNIIVVKEV